MVDLLSAFENLSLNYIWKQVPFIMLPIFSQQRIIIQSSKQVYKALNFHYYFSKGDCLYNSNNRNYNLNFQKLRSFAWYKKHSIHVPFLWLDSESHFGAFPVIITIITLTHIVLSVMSIDSYHLATITNQWVGLIAIHADGFYISYFFF